MHAMVPSHFVAVPLVLFACLVMQTRASSSETLVLYGDLVENLYEKSGLHNPLGEGDYEVTRNLYATERSGFIFGESAVWIGLTAVSSSRADIAVVIRGTLKVAEWIENLMVEETQFHYLDGSASDAYVHKGFFDLYTASDPGQDSTKTSMRQQLVEELGNLLSTGSYRTVTIVGHSLGGALSILSSFDIAKSDLTKRYSFHMNVYTFASPMVGDDNFKKMVEGTSNLDIVRMSDVRDVVPYLPSLNYKHAGQEISVDGCQYPSLMGFLDEVLEYHSLKRYLHTAREMKSASSVNMNITAFYVPGDIDNIGDFVKMIIASVKSGVQGMANLVSAMRTYVSNFSKPCK